MGSGKPRELRKKPNTRAAARARRDPFKAVRDELKVGGTSKLVTRAKTKQRKMLEDLELDLSGDQIDDLLQSLADGKKPPEKVGNEDVAGKDRIDFNKETKRDFWPAHAADPCAICKLPIAVKDRSIDHKTPWAIIRVGVTIRTVCKSNVHWDVAYFSDLSKLYNEEKNLRPVHKACNSSKGGQKGNDSITPQRNDRNVCKGAACDLPKAT